MKSIIHHILVFLEHYKKITSIIIGSIIVLIIIFTVLVFIQDKQKKQTVLLYEKAYQVIQNQTNLTQPKNVNDQSILVLLEEIIKLGTQKSVYYHLAAYQIAQIYLKQENMNKTIFYLQKIQQHGASFIPIYTKSLKILGKLYLRENKLDLAIDIFKQLIKSKINIFASEGHLYLGMIYEKLATQDSKYIDQAINEYKSIEADSISFNRAKDNLQILEALLQRNLKIKRESK